MVAAKTSILLENTSVLLVKFIFIYITKIVICEVVAKYMSSVNNTLVELYYYEHTEYSTFVSFYRTCTLYYIQQLVVLYCRTPITAVDQLDTRVTTLLHYHHKIHQIYGILFFMLRPSSGHHLFLIKRCSFCPR